MLYLLLFIIIIYFGLDYHKFKKCRYEIESGNNYMQTRFDTGNYGEYLTFRKFDKIEGSNRVLANVYVPKEDGSTTEVDLIFIHNTGIYAIESKNYSGWIYGNEKSKYWTQTLKSGKKHKFFNPIWQNAGHISALKRIIDKDFSEHIESIIVFSERCELKKINVENEKIVVVKRNQLVRKLKSEIEKREVVFSKEHIDSIYYDLLKHCHASDEVKKEHIRNIKSKA